jgi:hypothetical protein
MAIALQNGTNIVRTPSGTATHVGPFDATTIDLDVTRNSPNSYPEAALIWITAMLSGAGIVAPTTTQEFHANMAQRWWSWLQYWRMGKLQEICPDDCKDPGLHAQKELWAKQELCMHLKALGLRDEAICFDAEQQQRTKLSSKVCLF